MMSITLQSHVGSDGILKLEIPLELRDTDLKVEVSVEPLGTKHAPMPEELDWPPGFLDEFAGSIPDLERGPQGDYEVREELE